MSSEFERKLETYAELTVRVGLNLQAGQRLLIGAPAFFLAGTPIEAAPLVRKIAARAYKAGARLVDVLWNDPQVELTRYRHAPKESFEEYPAWRAAAGEKAAKDGDALLLIYSEDPDLLADQDPELVTAAQGAAFHHTGPLMDYIVRNATNWAIVSASIDGWAAKVFPNVPQEEQKARLWDAIFEMCRLNQTDPIAGWQEHVDQLALRSTYLNDRQYDRLKLSGPGTDLTVGLPNGHIWHSGRLTSETGIPFTANIPTEEVFTMPRRDRIDGIVTATRPLSYGGTLIEDFRLTFSGGQVVDFSAGTGENALKNLLDTDNGARSLGEIALVPHSSPISQSGLLFYNILFDENASNHLALGRAYQFSMEGGEQMSLEEFAAAGGNQSLIHIDFMIGSGDMNVDGLTVDGASEAIMRGGEWAFDVT